MVRLRTAPAVPYGGMPSLLEHAGGEDAIHRLEDIFYAKASPIRS